MKRDILLGVFAIVIAISATAQPGGFLRGKGGQAFNLTPEQQAELRIKKMTLALDLSSSQQEKLKPIILESALRRDAMMKIRRENRQNGVGVSNTFERMNASLDQKIAVQNKIKGILKEDQFEKWQRIRMYKNKGKTFQSKRGRNNRRCR